MRQRSKNYKRTIIFLLVLLCLPYVVWITDYSVSRIIEQYKIGHHISMLESGAWIPLPQWVHLFNPGIIVYAAIINFLASFLALLESLTMEKKSVIRKNWVIIILYCLSCLFILSTFIFIIPFERTIFDLAIGSSFIIISGILNSLIVILTIIKLINLEIERKAAEAAETSTFEE